MENTERIDPFTAITVMLTYCKGNKFECARYCLFLILNSEDVPDHLLPNDEEEALELIKNSRF